MKRTCQNPACTVDISARRQTAIYCSDRCRESVRWRTRPQTREKRLRERYGLTEADWTQLLVAQGDACAICRTTQMTKKGWVTDHCHDTGSVRGILCHPCNLMLGMAQDDPDRLMAAVAYLLQTKPLIQTIS